MFEIAVLAENNFGDTRSGGLAGPMGLFIIVLLAIVTVLLIRNMSARIRRLPDRFPDQGDEPDRSSGGSSANDRPSSDSSPSVGSPTVMSRSELNASPDGEPPRSRPPSEGDS